MTDWKDFVEGLPSQLQPIADLYARCVEDDESIREIQRIMGNISGSQLFPDRVKWLNDRLETIRQNIIETEKICAKMAGIV